MDNDTTTSIQAVLVIDEGNSLCVQMIQLGLEAPTPQKTLLLLYRSTLLVERHPAKEDKQHKLDGARLNGRQLWV